MKKNVVLFLHIPKAGGTTLSDIIYLQEKTRKQKEQRNVKAGAIFNSGILYHPAGFIREINSEMEEDLQLFLAHPDLRAVLGHFNFGFHERLDQPSTYITMMREPVGRVLSLFSFQRLVQSTKGNFWGVKIAENASVGDFVTKPPYQEIHNGQTRRIAGDWNPEVSDSLLLSKAKSNLVKFFSVVGLAERFEESNVLFRQALGWHEWNFSYAKNINPDRIRRSEISQDELNIIIEYNQLDMELYDFTQELFEEAIAYYPGDFKAALAEYQTEKRKWVEEVES